MSRNLDKIFIVTVMLSFNYYYDVDRRSSCITISKRILVLNNFSFQFPSRMKNYENIKNITYLTAAASVSFTIAKGFLLLVL